jgi:hypothetical protein
MKKEAKKKDIDRSVDAVCPICGQTHPKQENLGIKAERVEVDSLVLFNTRVQVARQAASPADIPQGVTADQVKVFVQAALYAQAEALAQQRGWWQEVIAKYNLPRDKNVFVDFDTGDFYIIISQ